MRGSELVQTDLGVFSHEFKREGQGTKIRFYENYVTKEICYNGDRDHDTQVKRETNYARELAKQNHPNVIKFEEILEIQSGTLMVMEKCEMCLGKYLDTQINKRISVNECDLLAVDIIRQITQGMKFLQELFPGFIHRDLTADNIFVQFFEEKPIFKIADFGIARIMDIEMTQDINQKQQVAPELQHAHYDQKVDIYSLGSLIYFFLEPRELKFILLHDSRLFTRPTNRLTELLKSMLQPQTLRISWKELFKHEVMSLQPRAFLNLEDEFNLQNQSRFRGLKEYLNLSTVASAIELDLAYFDSILHLNTKFEQVRYLDSQLNFLQLFALGEVWQKIIKEKISKLATSANNKQYCLKTFIDPITIDQGKLKQANMIKVSFQMTIDEEVKHLKEIIVILQKIKKDKFTIIITILKEFIKKY